MVVSLLLLTNLSLKQISDNIYGTIRPKLERQAEKDKKSFAGETIPVNEFTRKPPDELQTLDEAFRQERQEVHRETQIKAAEDKNEDKKDDIPVISKDIQRKALEHGYRIPPTDLLIRPQVNIYEKDRARLAENNARLLEETLNSFGVSAKVTQVSRGPVITRYELHPAPGVKVSRIVSLADDIALNLAAPSVRIEAPIPGKAAVGIEVPNRDISPVYLREVLESEEFIYHPSRIAVALGKDIAGKNIIADIAQMPHLLIAGATGSGKAYA